jgi:hypothetical protein
MAKPWEDEGARRPVPRALLRGWKRCLGADRETPHRPTPLRDAGPSFSRRGRRLSSDSGSVLIEAIVAVAIVAMMLAVTYRSVGDSVLRARAAEASRTAMMGAQSRLASVGAEIPLTPGETTGVDGAYSWRVEIAPVDEDASAMGRLLSVTASVRDREPTDRAVLRTLRLEPAG